MAYVISCSSTCDLTTARLAEREIAFIPFHFQLDGVDMRDDMGTSIEMDEFYHRMDMGAETRTSQINMGEYAEFFEGFLKKGLDVLHVDLSSGISGTVNSAYLARDVLREKYPDRKIMVMDSLAASSGFGLLMELIADNRDAGMTIEENAKWIEENRLKVHHWFFSTDLKFYIKGGRVTRTAGFVGNLLNICPLLNVDFKGRLIPREKIRTKKRVIRRIVEKMEDSAENGRDYDGYCYLSQSACYADASAVKDLVEESFPKLKGKVRIFNIGPTIGSHTGPGTVALFFVGTPRPEETET